MQLDRARQRASSNILRRKVPFIPPIPTRDTTARWKHTGAVLEFKRRTDVGMDKARRRCETQGPSVARYSPRWNKRRFDGTGHHVEFLSEFLSALYAMMELSILQKRNCKRLNMECQGLMKSNEVSVISVVPGTSDADGGNASGCAKP